MKSVIIYVGLNSLKIYSEKKFPIPKNNGALSPTKFILGRKENSFSFEPRLIRKYEIKTDGISNDYESHLNGIRTV